MPHQFARIAAPYSLLLVMDSRVGVVPDGAGTEAIVAGPSCVAVGTLTEIDGETEVHLCDARGFSGYPDLALVWGGTIASAGVVEILSVDLVSLATIEVVGDPNLQIWANDPSEPDQIWVVNV